MVAALTQAYKPKDLKFDMLVAHAQAYVSAESSEIWHAGIPCPGVKAESSEI